MAGCASGGRRQEPPDYRQLPELFGVEGNGVRGPALVAGLCAAATTFFAVKFLLRYFQTNRLTPFGIYCMGLGVTCTLVFALGG